MHSTFNYSDNKIKSKNISGILQGFAPPRMDTFETMLTFKGASACVLLVHGMVITELATLTLAYILVYFGNPVASTFLGQSFPGFPFSIRSSLLSFEILLYSE